MRTEKDRNKLVMINIKVTQAQLRKMKTLAKKKTQGNVSELIRGLVLGSDGRIPRLQAGLNNILKRLK